MTDTPLRFGIDGSAARQLKDGERYYRIELPDGREALIIATTVTVRDGALTANTDGEVSLALAPGMWCSALHVRSPDGLRPLVDPAPRRAGQPCYQKRKLSMTDKAAPINRPLTDDERHLLNMLAIRVIADQTGVTDQAAADALDDLNEREGLYLEGDSTDVYIKAGKHRHVVVHATREWLAFFAANPDEPIDLDKYCHPIEDEDTEE